MLIKSVVEALGPLFLLAPVSFFAVTFPNNQPTHKKSEPQIRWVENRLTRPEGFGRPVGGFCFVAPLFCYCSLFFKQWLWRRMKIRLEKGSFTLSGTMVILPNEVGFCWLVKALKLNNELRL